MAKYTSKIDSKDLNEFGNSLRAQEHQRKQSQQQLNIISEGIKSLSCLNDKNLSDLDYMLTQAETLCRQQGISMDKISQKDIDEGARIVNLTKEEKQSIVVPYFEKLSAIAVYEDDGWNEYLDNIERYAGENALDLTKDPFDELLTVAEKNDIIRRINDDYTMKKANCDKYDYLIAAFCGLASGLIDSFFVGMPSVSKLGNWTDEKANQFVVNMTRGIYKSDKRSTFDGKPMKIPESLQNCISYLEQRFQINYDARYAADLKVEDGVLSDMWTKNHHLKSLAHAPNIIGLVFSIINQFTGNASFICKGQIISVVPNENKKGFELQGSTFPSKLFSGFCNWLGHLLSDFVGSSGTIDTAGRKTSRGSGLGIPFYELFQFCELGSFNVNEEQLSLAQLSVKMFENGYDLRFGVTMAIPVIFNELMIRLLWSLKSRYFHKKSWHESIPLGNQSELRRMLLVGHGILCLVDAVDTSIRSGGEILTLALHLNMAAWTRFAFSGMLEVRTLYKENVIDIYALDHDLEMEWKRMMR